VDFALVEPVVAGFATMNGAYRHRPDEPEPPEKASRPFSANRRGFVISEGVGAIVVSSEDFAKTHGLKYNAEIAGWSMTSDAFHFVAPNFDTVRRCVAESIADAGIDPERIDSVNAHAASTKVGDRVEYDALRAVFGDRLPPVSANKSMIGHAMGASSAIETIFAMEAMRKDLLLPTINYKPEPGMEIDCAPHVAEKLEQEYVLKNSFGFGGCNSCIVFKKTA
jgi:3-oxoacyl-[acyl-carrier-protein] synthase II